MQGLSEGFLESKSLSYAAVAIALLVAVVLILLIFRIAFGHRLRLPRNGRTRQPRLGIVDAFDLDRQRQLVIVRRDNVEHLLMIGGPNDLVIESEIIRADGRDSRDGRIRDKDLREKDLREAPMPAGVSWPAPTEVPAARSAPRNKPFPPAAMLEPEPGFAAMHPIDEAIPPSAIAPATPRPPVFPIPARRAPTAPVVNSPGPRMPSREPLRTDPAQKFEPGGGPAKGTSRASLATPFVRSSVQRQVPGTEAKPARSSTAEAPPPVTLASTGLADFDDLPSTPPKVHAEPEGEPSAAPMNEVPVSARATGPAESEVPDVSASDPVRSQIDTLEEEMAKLLGRG